MPMTAAYAPALNHGFEGFLDFLRDQEAGPAVLSPKRFSDVLSIQSSGEAITSAPAASAICPSAFLSRSEPVLIAAPPEAGTAGG